jgi:hypothetical protein
LGHGTQARHSRPRPATGIAAAYANGRIFLTLTTVGLALKLPSAPQADLIARGAKPLRYFRSGPIKKDYVVVPSSMMSDTDALGPWVARSVRFSHTFLKARHARAVCSRSAK